MDDIVAVGRTDNAADGYAHELGHEAADGVAKGAGRDDKVDGPVGLRCALQVGPKVVGRLHHNPSPVDRVDGHHVVLGHERTVREEELERLGLLVRVAFGAEHVDVGRLAPRHHLQLLDVRDAAMRVEAEDVDVLAAGDACNRCRACVAARLDNDVCVRAALPQVHVEQLRHHLLANVLEGQCWPEARVEKVQVAKDLLAGQWRLGAAIKRLERRGRELLQLREREVGILLHDPGGDL